MSPTSARRHSATVLRLAHKTITFRDSVWLLAVLGLFLISACSSPDRQAMDRLNALSYAYHYRNIDSVEYYASAAKGTAEGLNNLAFVKMVRMDYKAAEDYLNQIPEMTDNQLELLVCYVQQMRLCQRRSRNKDFHDFRERAVTCMKRIDEEAQPTRHPPATAPALCRDGVWHRQFHLLLLCRPRAPVHRRTHGYRP